MGDRLKKARGRTGMTAKEFAAAIGVSEKTITNAEGDKVAVRAITLNAWALATGVDRHWLETGEGTPGGPDGGQPVTDTPSGGSGEKLARLTAKKRSRAVTRRYLAA